VTAVAIILGLADWFMPTMSHAEWLTLPIVVALGTFALAILAQVFRSGPVTLHRIQGAIAVYLLLGLAWTSAYELVLLYHPGALTGDIAGGDAALQSRIYFSFATLTTVGYGDIEPVHPIARSLAVLEALVGQLYPAILIGRLVSLEIQDRRK